MFNKIYTLGRTRTEFVDRNITVTEKRAVTDESVKLLNEFQEKALENLLLKGETDNNIISARWYIFKSYLDYSYAKSIRVVVTLNNKEYLIEDLISYFDIEDKSTSDILKKVYEMISKKITEVIFKDIDNKTASELLDVR